MFDEHVLASRVLQARGSSGFEVQLLGPTALPARSVAVASKHAAPFYLKGPYEFSTPLNFMRQRRLDADQFCLLMKTLCLLVKIVGWPHQRPRRKRNVSSGSHLAPF